MAFYQHAKIETMTNDESHKHTVNFYNNSEISQEYTQRILGRKIDWLLNDLRRAVAGLDKSSRIFEFGSGPGDDALHLQKWGYKVEVSDAAQTFVDVLNNFGFKARRFDVLNDDFPNDYDLIFANFVLQHFPVQQLEMIIVKVFQSLLPGGRFSFTIAAGKGAKWRTNKAGNAFYWCAWSQEDIQQLLEKTGFCQISIAQHGNNPRGAWLSAIAAKPG